MKKDCGYPQSLKIKVFSSWNRYKP